MVTSTQLDFRASISARMSSHCSRNYVMKYITLLLFSGVLLGCGRGDSFTSQDRLAKVINELAEAKTAQERFYALNDAAKESFVVGNAEDAKKYAQELMTLLTKFPDNWNYGNAVQDANLVLGRIELKKGHIDEAKRYLMAAGSSPGSPQMDTFGPNVSLAKDLLEKGERDVVIQYLDLCRKFWEMDRGRLDKWTKEIKDGKTPDFGANLDY